MSYRQEILASTFLAALCVLNLSAASAWADRLNVYTVNYPLKYFAERIGGDHVEVVFPAPAGVDPAYWTPDRRTISDYQKADLILLNGAHYAEWIEKVTLPGSRMVNTSRKFRDEYIKLESAVTHSHGSGGAHAHEDAAFTIWLDPELAVKQAKEIERNLSREKPELKSSFQKNYEELERDLMALDREIEEIVSKDPTLPLVVSHPVYDYLTRRYRLNIQSVHWEPDEYPSQKQWLELRRILNEHSAHWMIWEDEPLHASAELLKSIGVQSIIFAPCGNVPAEGDFMDAMRRNVENLAKAFK